MIELIENAFLPYYEDDPDPNSDPDPNPDDPGDGGSSDDDGGSDDGGGKGKKKTFTQKELNDILAKEKGKWKESADKAIKELERQKNLTSTTAEDKKRLEDQIEELKSANLTEQQKAERERKKLADTAKKREEELSTEVENWKSRFTEAEITRAIADAAAAEGAFNARHIQAILRDKTRLVDVTNDDGEPTGQLMPKVKFPDKDKDGKDIMTDLTVTEAVKRMKELVDEYGNLFKGTASGGIGGSAGPGSGGNFDVSKMSQEDYEKNRAKIKQQAGASRRR